MDRSSPGQDGPSPEVSPPPVPAEMQFDKVEYATGPDLPPATAAACTSCGKAIKDSYFEVNGQIVCPDCKSGVQATIQGGSKVGRMAKAVVLGFGAALLSSLAYFLVVKLTKMELAIATIAMGWAVGYSVHYGASGRGGWFYQFTAVALTYLSIALALGAVTYASLSDKKKQELLGSFQQPDLVEDKIRKRDFELIRVVLKDENTTALLAREGASAQRYSTGTALSVPDPDGTTRTIELGNFDNFSDTATLTDNVERAMTPSMVDYVRSIVVWSVFILALPILSGMEGPIAFLIYGFGLWQAFRMNRRPHIVVTGPYSTRAGIATVPDVPPIPSSEDKIV